MKTQHRNSALQARNIAYIAAATGLLLLVPLVAMQFTDEVAWDLEDFIASGVLLFSAGLIYVYELVARRASSTMYRLAIGLAVVAVLLITWAQVAVGIFD